MKKYYQSKKWWFNVLTILVVVATFFGYVPDQEVAEKTTGVLLTFAPLVNLVLVTFFTKKPITT